MTDYIRGVLIGVACGYVVSLVTLVVVWSLCEVSSRSDRWSDRND